MCTAEFLHHITLHFLTPKRTLWLQLEKDFSSKATKMVLEECWATNSKHLLDFTNWVNFMERLNSTNTVSYD